MTWELQAQPMFTNVATLNVLPLLQNDFPEFSVVCKVGSRISYKLVFLVVVGFQIQNEPISDVFQDDEVLAFSEGQWF